MSQLTYNVEVQHFQTSPLDLDGIHLSSRKVLQRRDFLNFIEGQHQEEENQNEEIKILRVALDEEKKSESNVEKFTHVYQHFLHVLKRTISKKRNI